MTHYVDKLQFIADIQSVSGANRTPHFLKLPTEKLLNQSGPPG